MDSWSFIAVERVFRAGGIRAAARALGRPAANVAAAVERVESALAQNLFRAAGQRLVATLEGRRLMPDIARCADAARDLAALSRQDPTRFSVSLPALFRFCEVARSGSIRKAAMTIRIGQPQLSRQMSSLEKAFGRPLLARAPDGITLLPDGTDVLAHAEVMEAIWRRLTRTAGHQFRRAEATGRLGSIIPLGPESSIAKSLAALAARWMSERPAHPLFISSTTAEDLLNGLQRGIYDLALLDVDHVSEPLERRVIARTGLALVGHEALFSGPSGKLETILKEQPIVVPSLRSGLRQKATTLIAAHLSDSERDAMHLLEVDSLPVIVNLLLEHGFVAVLPRSAFMTMKAPLGAIALGPAYDLTLSLAWLPRPASRRLAERVLAMLAL
ncbi:LysR family transcriptional regulator [Martelella alba]|nr:LysR family transcriptional regulator [Martelella alba]